MNVAVATSVSIISSRLPLELTDRAGVPLPISTLFFSATSRFLVCAALAFQPRHCYPTRHSPLVVSCLCPVFFLSSNGFVNGISFKCGKGVERTLYAYALLSINTPSFLLFPSHATNFSSSSIPLWIAIRKRQEASYSKQKTGNIWLGITLAFSFSSYVSGADFP